MKHIIMLHMYKDGVNTGKGSSSSADNADGEGSKPPSEYARRPGLHHYHPHPHCQDSCHDHHHNSHYKTHLSMPIGPCIDYCPLPLFSPIQ